MSRLKMNRFIIASLIPETGEKIHEKHQEDVRYSVNEWISGLGY